MNALFAQIQSQIDAKDAQIATEQASIAALNTQIAQLLAENAALKSALDAMTEDRNLWQDAHGDDCPYKDEAIASRVRVEGVVL